MLTFVVGAAFAFTAGTLDIVGTVNLAEQDYVVWSNVTAGPGFTALGIEVGATHSAQIVNERGRTDQRIVWNINFSEADGGFAMAAITATATNNSNQDAIITSVTPVWSWTDVATGFTAADFGLDVTVPAAGLFFAPIAPGGTASITVEVEWDGTIPAGFTFDPANEYTFAAEFTIEFEYAVA